MKKFLGNGDEYFEISGEDFLITGHPNAYTVLRPCDEHYYHKKKRILEANREHLLETPKTLLEFFQDLNEAGFSEHSKEEILLPKLIHKDKEIPIEELDMNQNRRAYVEALAERERLAGEVCDKEKEYLKKCYPEKHYQRVVVKKKDLDNKYMTDNYVIKWPNGQKLKAELRETYSDKTKVVLEGWKKVEVIE